MVHFQGQVEATRKSKPRKTQTVFSQQQLTVLEANYNNNNYISTDERNEIAQRLQMTVPQVRWLYNCIANRDHNKIKVSLLCFMTYMS